jgi:CubicO group peptidase (beta-lactamase class C family)
VAAAGLVARRAWAADVAPPRTPITGRAHPDLTAFDELMTGFVQEHEVPGASLAVARHGRLVYARGFGHADVERRRPVEPADLFRIASVSKPLTATAVLQLIEERKLGLDTRAFDVLKYPPHPHRGRKADPRLGDITVQHLLQHTAGWDRDVSFDPIDRVADIAEAMHVPLPIGPETIIRFMIGLPLDFAPGERYAYSNLGYLVLGRLVAALGGGEYEARVRERVLRPLGLTGPRLGRSAVDAGAESEVHYYDRRARTVPAVAGPRIGARVPIPYGGLNIEGFEAHGGWIASAIDLVRFACAFDDPARSPLLGAESVGMMFARPDGRAGHEADGTATPTYYGCGWSVRPIGSRGLNTWHVGHFIGTSSLLVRRWDGLDWAVLFNMDSDADGVRLAPAIDPLVHHAADRVRRWPDVDLFETYLGTPRKG